MNNNYRSEYCGLVKSVSEKTTIVGWVQKIRVLSKMNFIDLRDWTGLLQIVVFLKDKELYDKAKSLTPESVVQFKGAIVKRKTANSELKTGDYELTATTINIISMSDEIPMEINSLHTSLENTRMKYRYLDIRNPKMFSNLQIRNKIVHKIRNFFQDNNFLEIETPILNNSTPEGARDFIVPSRHHWDKFYSLPQSPQLFKQLLMIAGIEKYFQICRNFRDEDLRADRQLEFTQLDIEVSFSTIKEFKISLETLMKIVCKESINPEWRINFSRIDYKEMINKYGSDKADLRYPYEIQNLPGDCPSNSLKSIEFEKVDLKRNDINVFKKIISSYKLIEFQTNIDELIDSKNGIFALKNDSNEKSFKFVAIGVKKMTLSCLGEIRAFYILNFCKEIPEYKFAWVENFPLFKTNDNNKLESSHHPFTKPLNWKELTTKKPEEIFGTHYDLILNGFELGSGSERITNQEIQKQIFKILNYGDLEIEKNFGFFMNAFKYGVPPHLGMAIGVDRLVMILTNNKNIREVIAFPKNSAGICPLSNSPSRINKENLRELGILKREKK